MNFKITKVKRFISVLLLLSIAATTFQQTEIGVYAESSATGSDITESQTSEYGYEPETELSKQEYNGHLYSVIDTPMSWTEAKEYCEKIGGHLVTIADNDEQEFVQNQLLTDDTSNRMYWIGGILKDGSWQWVTDEVFEYTNWESAEPTSGGYQPYIQMYTPKCGDICE